MKKPPVKSLIQIFPITLTLLVLSSCTEQMHRDEFTFPLLESCKYEVESSLTRLRAELNNQFDFELVSFDRQLDAIRDVVGFVRVTSSSIDDWKFRAIVNNPILDCYPTESMVFDGRAGYDEISRAVGLGIRQGSDNFYINVDANETRVYRVQRNRGFGSEHDQPN